MKIEKTHSKFHTYSLNMNNSLKILLLLSIVGIGAIIYYVRMSGSSSDVDRNTVRTIKADVDMNIVRNIIGNNEWRLPVFSWNTERGRIYATSCNWAKDCYDGGTAFFDAQGKFLMSCYSGWTGWQRCDDPLLKSLQPENADFKMIE